jgi:hypothetical protein
MFFFVLSNVKLRGTPTLKLEQRATLDETHDLEMPRQGVSLLNAMLGLANSYTKCDSLFKRRGKL